jgi:hypothetical protein
MSSLSAPRRTIFNPSLDGGRCNAFAHAPPSGNVIVETWDRFKRKGYRDEERVKMDPEEEKRLVAKLKAFTKQPTLSQREVSGDTRQHRYCLADWTWRSEGHGCAP